jgi:hypothetical protein
MFLSVRFQAKSQVHRGYLTQLSSVRFVLNWESLSALGFQGRNLFDFRAQFPTCHLD